MVVTCDQAAAGRLGLIESDIASPGGAPRSGKSASARSLRSSAGSSWPYRMTRRASPRVVPARRGGDLGTIFGSLADQGVRALHDRRLPQSGANINHIAVSAADVFVIGAKCCMCRPYMRVVGILRSGPSR